MPTAITMLLVTVDMAPPRVSFRQLTLKTGAHWNRHAKKKAMVQAMVQAYHCLEMNGQVDSLTVRAIWPVEMEELDANYCSCWNSVHCHQLCEVHLEVAHAVSVVDQD